MDYSPAFGYRGTTSLDLTKAVANLKCSPLPVPAGFLDVSLVYTANKANAQCANASNTLTSAFLIQVLSSALGLQASPKRALPFLRSLFRSPWSRVEVAWKMRNDRKRLNWEHSVASHGLENASGNADSPWLSIRNDSCLGACQCATEAGMAHSSRTGGQLTCHSNQSWRGVRVPLPSYVPKALDFPMRCALRVSTQSSLQLNNALCLCRRRPLHQYPALQ